MGIVHVPEGRHIFPNLTVRENLLLGGYFRSDKGNKETLDQVLKLFPALKERINQKGRKFIRRGTTNASHCKRPHGKAQAPSVG